MSGKIKLLIGFIAFIGLLVLANVFFNYYEENYSDKLISETSQEDTDENQDKNNEQEQNDKQETADTENKESADEEDKKIEAIDFTVYDSDENEVKLSDVMDGTPLVVNFWASWCPPCKQEFPHFQKLKDELDGEVNFMMVSLTGMRDETKEDAENYIEENEYDFDVYFDLEQDAMYTYGIQSIPSTLFIDTDGFIAYAQAGMFTEKSLRNAIDLIYQSEE